MYIYYLYIYIYIYIHTFHIIHLHGCPVVMCPYLYASDSRFPYFQFTKKKTIRGSQLDPQGFECSIGTVCLNSQYLNGNTRIT